jgi:hypothetical protein
MHTNVTTYRFQQKSSSKRATRALVLQETFLSQRVQSLAVSILILSRRRASTPFHAVSFLAVVTMHTNVTTYRFQQKSSRKYASCYNFAVAQWLQTALANGSASVHSESHSGMDVVDIMCFEGLIRATRSEIQVRRRYATSYRIKSNCFLRFGLHREKDESRE